jgi:hypothetical protein
MLYPVELWVQATATAAFSAKSGCAATGVQSDLIDWFALAYSADKATACDRSVCETVESDNRRNCFIRLF